MIKKIFTSLLILFVILIQLQFVCSQTTDKYWLKYKYPSIIVENKLWVGTPKGLYQYHSEEDSWAIYGKHNGLSDNNIKIIQYDGDFLWVVTSKGVDCGDIKLNKWLNYSSKNGLPSDSVTSIAFQKDYVWITTDKGAARYDKLIQEWEKFSIKNGLPDSMVYDVAVDKDLVYFATAKGLAEYDINFEKWRYYGKQEGITCDTIRFIYQTTDYLWLFTNEGPFRFSKKMHTSISFSDDKRLKYNNIRDVVVNSDKFWTATNDGLIIYDPESNVWRNYLEENNLPNRLVKSLYISQDIQWFITESGIAEYDGKNKTWQRYGKSQGLSSELYDVVLLFSGKIFLFNDNAIDYYKSIEKRWYNYRLKDINASSGYKKINVSLDRTKGSFVQFGDDVKFSISGSRYNLRHQRNYEYQLDSKKNESKIENYGRGDLKAQLSFGERTVNAFYNNIDYIDKTLYGVRYKGKKGDVIQEANWGDIRYEQGKNDLVPSLDIFGVSTRLEIGPKTERYKRSLFSAKAYSGEKKTATKTNFFTGNQKKGEVTIKDKDYLKNIYFYIDTTKTLLPVERGTEKIFVDDRNIYTNDDNTLLNNTLAGITGDFNLQHPNVDYLIDNSKGLIRFMQPVKDTAIIVIQGISNGIPFEKVLKNYSFNNNVSYNQYFTGGMEIIPNTFNLQITDSLGYTYPLSTFGLDDDRNGRVDPEKINYKDGILTFPSTKPFPSIIYEKNNKKSFYTLKIKFQSEITIFNLSNMDLLRGSETLMVDGETLRPGEDYVLDYTSGTLLIIKEGIIAENSEIEVKYDYYKKSDEKFQFAGVGFGPSDNVLVEANYYGFDKTKPDSSLTKYNGYNVFSELKWKINNVDFKLTPEFAHNEGGNRNGNSMQVRADISTKKVRLFTIFDKSDSSFTQLFEKKFQLGNVNERQTVGATYLPYDFLEFDANWKKQSTSPKENGQKFSEESMNGKVLFSKNLLPALSLSASQRTLDTLAFQSTKQIVKGDLEYQLPEKILKPLSLKAMRLYGVWRRSWENKKLAGPSNSFDPKRYYDNQYIRLDFTPVDLVQINAYYRMNDTKKWGSDSIPNNSNDRLNQHKKVFLDATVDKIKGLNITLRFQGEAFDMLQTANSKVQDYSLSRRLQSSVRIYPGKWVPKFNPFTFELGYNPTWRGYLENIDNKLSFGDRYWKTSFDYGVNFSENNQMYQIRGEWRPVSNFVLFSGLEFYDISTQNFTGITSTNIIKFNPKIEYRPGMNSIITFQYFRNKENSPGYIDKLRDNPMLWIENRFSEKLLAKLYITYYSEERTIGKINDYTQNFTPMLGLTYRFLRKGTGESKGEIRNDLSVSLNRQRVMKFEANTNSYSNNFGIDYFPTSVLILRFRVVTTYNDYLNSMKDTFQTQLEMRMTAQF